MKKCSQSSHHALAQLNITPLLDLAFVLLIIFVITTPLIEKGLDLKLPTAQGSPEKKLDRADIRTVDISAQGVYVLNKRPMKVDQVVRQLTLDYRSNPNLVIYIRADENSRMKEYVALTDACTRNGISRFSIRTEPPGNR